MGHDQDRRAPISTAREWWGRPEHRVAFGESLARRVWRRVHAAPPGEGLIHEFHRDFCGHGLIRTERGVKLCEIEDGHRDGHAIAEWTSEEEFVAFFARQTDWSCAGFDPAEPVFHTEDSWAQGNQRLTRAILERYAGWF
ncbi:MAG TPA: hypothetical protein VD970_13155 [Acetobacteraceae bacterium]|nr:hypothetical protein [Acetobacteraceae bacterium]